MNLNGPRRSTPTDEDATAPVELPHVLVTVAADGTLTATVDGTPFPSPDASAWTRATFGPLMDAITKDRTIAVRVEVRENDGSVFTDILRTRKPRRAAGTDRDPGAGDSSESPRPTDAALARGHRGRVRPPARMSPSRRSSPTPTPPEPAKPGRSSTSTTYPTAHTR